LYIHLYKHTAFRFITKGKLRKQHIGVKPSRIIIAQLAISHVITRVMYDVARIEMRFISTEGSERFVLMNYIPLNKLE